MEDNQVNVSKLVSVSTSCRHVRIAYLIEDNENSRQNLDVIFKDSYSRWGGRYTLIVPLQNGNVVDEYWEWLKRFDPDIVYTFSEVSSKWIERIDREICPIRFQEKGPRPDDFLTSLSLLHSMKKGVNKFIFVSAEMSDSQFLLDNFGSVYKSFGSYHLEEVREYFEVIYVSREWSKLNNNEFKYMENEAQLLEEFSRSKLNRIVSLKDLASQECEVINDAYHDWSSKLNLFIGDSFVDRISFWNSYLSNSYGHQDCRDYSLIISKSLIEDDEFVFALAKYVKHEMMNPSNIYQVHVRSNSLSEEEAKDFIEKISKLVEISGSSFVFNRINSVEDCAARKYHQYSARKDVQPAKQQLVSGYSFYIDCGYPNFLNDFALRSDHRGNVIISVILERQKNYSETLSNQHIWLLPKRIDISRLFVEDDYESRVDCKGILNIKINILKQNNTILTPPSDGLIFSVLLNYKNMFWQVDLRSKVKGEVYFRSAISDKGRYLMQIFTLFSGVNDAFRFLSHNFLRDYFMELCSASSGNELGEKLRSKLNRLSGDIKDNIEYLMEIIPEIAEMVKIPKNIFKYSSMEEEYVKYAEDFIESHESYLLDQKQDHIEYCKKTLEVCLKSLISLGLVYQGYTITCNNCANKNWITIDKLGVLNKCQVCGNNMNSHILEPWQFQLNQMFVAAVRNHGVLPQILTLAKLCREARHSFYFQAPTNVFKTEKHKGPNYDIDLLCVQDGKLIVGEVKTSGKIRDCDLRDLAECASIIKADKVVLSFYCKRDSKIDGYKSKFELLCANIEVVIYTLEDFESLGSHLMLPS